MLAIPNSAPLSGNALMRAEAKVIPMSDDSITEPHAEQPTPKVPMTSPKPLAPAALPTAMRRLK